jgi:hypothetical protein
MGFLHRLRAYAAHPDPLAAAVNTIALAVGFNLPLYPLFVIYAGGSGALPSTLLAGCGAPFFLALPAITRRHPRLGRALLPVIGTLNTLYCTWILGELSATQMFFVPVAMAAALSFHRREALLMLGLLGLPLAAFLVFQGRYPAPPHAFDAASLTSLMRMNAFSVACLTGFIGLVFANLRDPGE